MRVRLNLKPGMGGTKKELAEYGDKLVCVRYRYDPARGRRYKTVEIIVDEIEWVPSGYEVDPDTDVFIRIGREEIKLRQRVKQAGASWIYIRRLWRLRYDRVRDLGLLERIVWDE